MSKLIVEMEMPKVCITKGGYYGNCPMDRVWCIQRNAPSEMVIKDAYADMTESIPSWCPIKGVLPEEHGELIDRDEIYIKIKSHNTERPDRTYRMGLIAEKHICLDDICRAKTVIAAERKDDEQG